MKKLIVVDGVDASGKETHTNFIFKLLKNNEKNVEKISFPDYESDSSALVKMYLAGYLGESASDVNAYAASSFYAVDRFVSFKKINWGKDFYSNPDETSYVVADRYVTSNMIHQASKIENQEEKDAFLEWLNDYEYNKLGLPTPDIVIFLNMPIWAAKTLMKNRANKITGTSAKDIHERDTDYLDKSYNNAMYVAKKFGWTIVNCTDGERIKSLEEIQEEIQKIVEKI